MRLSTNLLSLACLLFTLNVPHSVAQASRLSESTGIRFIQAFLAAVYPELMSQEAHLSVFSLQPFDKPLGQPRTVRFTVWDHTPGWYLRVRSPFNERYPNGPESKRLMDGRVRLDDKGRLAEFEAQDSFAIHSGKNSDLRQLVESHPDWKEQQAFQALKEAGVRYGPSQQEEFLKTNPLRILEPFLGKLTIREVKFDTLSPAAGSLPSTAFFQWHLVVQGERAGDPPSAYVLHFEPFGGKLTEIKGPG